MYKIKDKKIMKTRNFYRKKTETTDTNNIGTKLLSRHNSMK